MSVPFDRFPVPRGVYGQYEPRILLAGALQRLTEPDSYAVTVDAGYVTLSAGSEQYADYHRTLRHSSLAQAMGRAVDPDGYLKGGVPRLEDGALTDTDTRRLLALFSHLGALTCQALAAEAHSEDGPFYMGLQRAHEAHRDEALAAGTETAVTIPSPDEVSALYAGALRRYLGPLWVGAEL